MDARLKTPEDPRPLTREECIVETVLGIIGGATVIEDGIERQIGPHDIHGVLYHLREACLTTQRFRARQSKQAVRAIKQLSIALRRANQSKGGLPEGIRLVLGLDRMIHHLAAYGKAHRKPKPDAISLTLAYSCGVSECIFHSVPDMARDFYTVSARPGHERNLIVPDFAAHGRDRVAEGQDRFWIPCSGSRLELS